MDRFINFSFNAPDDDIHQQDEVYNYAKYYVILFGIQDAIKEDGKHVLYCWQYLLPIFHNSGKIILIRLFFLCQCYYDLSLQQAEQMLCSTFINTKGVRGRNTPLDLYQEHLNRLCKECIKGLGSNKIKVSIVRYSKALGILEEMLDNSDEYNNVSIPSSVHQPLSCHQDGQLIIKQLQQSRIFDIIPYRKHQHFKKTKECTAR